jgi:hypothetical protein
MVRDVYQALHDKALTDTPAGTNASNSSSSSAAGNGTELLTKALPLLLREHQCWTTGPKAVQVQGPDGSMHNFSRCAGCIYIYVLCSHIPTVDSLVGVANG